MSNHPLVLLVRFLLEIIALFALGYWAWTTHSGALRILLTVLLPLLAAIVWGVFRVPGYPGDAPVPVPGVIRLLLEGIVFGGAIWAFYASSRPSWGLVMVIAVFVHYLVSYDYIIELIKA